MNVPVGPASIVGYSLTLLGTAATAWAAATTHPAIPPEALLIVTIAAGVLTNLGRQLQAPPAPVVPAESLTERPQSGVKPEPV